MSKKEAQEENPNLGIAPKTLASFLVNLERAGLITINRKKLRVKST
jgi:predicted transcriptional regulator